VREVILMSTVIFAGSHSRCAEISLTFERTGHRTRSIYGRTNPTSPSRRKTAQISRPPNGRILNYLILKTKLKNISCFKKKTVLYQAANDGGSQSLNANVVGNKELFMHWYGIAGPLKK
jgi:hypothetical protein